MNKKQKIIILISIIIIVIIIFINIFINKPERKLIKYIKNLDFINHENSFIYEKQTSEYNLEEYNKKVEKNNDAEYEILYFNTNTYELTKDKMTYSNGINKNFTPTFNYTNDKLTYTYRINFDNVNVIIEGSYNIETEEFTCNPTFYYQIDIEQIENDICNKIKYEVETFKYETLTLIQKPELLNYMKENN